MIEIRNLSLSIKGHNLLNDISLTLEDGRVYALLGENGSGKTTLIRVLTSFYRDYSGSVKVKGKELRTCKRSERGRIHSLMPQTLPYSDLTVRSFLSVFDDGQRELEKFGLSDFLDKRMDTLSGGERQMVFLSLTLSHKTLMYAFDEPEASLDVHYREQAEKALLALKAQGHIVIVSFHDINRALRIADDIIILSQGHLLFSGSKPELFERKVLETAFGLERGTIITGDGSSHELFI